jgi:purine-binding chemotaxis protein CheW
MTTATPSRDYALPGKYLTFSLGAEHFSVSVLRVREIMTCKPITAVPRMPHYVKGVINVRGKVIPVIDLGERFSLMPPPPGSEDRRCIIIVQFFGQSGSLQNMGLIVDVVLEVCQLHAADIEATPDFGSTLDSRFISAMAKTGQGVRALLDIDKLLNLDEVIDWQSARTALSLDA